MAMNNEKEKKKTVVFDENENFTEMKEEKDIEQKKKSGEKKKYKEEPEFDEEVDNVKEEKEENIEKGTSENIKQEKELDVNDLLKNVVVLEEKIQQLEAEKEVLNNRMLRIQADFNNYRKRSEKEMIRIHTTTLVEIIGELLPVMDNFERALDQKDTGEDFRKGVEMIYRQLLTFLERNGVEVINAVGKEFDHNYHNAVTQVETDEYETGVIVDELQKGYILEEHVIRPSMVKVAK